MSEAQTVELAAVTKRYGDALAVDAISLKIPAGKYCCLLGPSGCGKSSTLRMIAGHEDVTDGDIMIGPRIVNDDPPAARGTAMMFQNYALFPHLSCQDNVAFSLKMRGVAKADCCIPNAVRKYERLRPMRLLSIQPSLRKRCSATRSACDFMPICSVSLPSVWAEISSPWFWARSPKTQTL